MFKIIPSSRGKTIICFFITMAKICVYLALIATFEWDIMGKGISARCGKKDGFHFVRNVLN